MLGSITCCDFWLMPVRNGCVGLQRLHDQCGHPNCKCAHPEPQVVIPGVLRDVRSPVLADPRGVRGDTVALLGGMLGKLYAGPLAAAVPWRISFFFFSLGRYFC
jgi:hypothetical protein